MNRYAENFTNILFRFALSQVNKNANDALFNADVQTTDLEKIKPKTVRVGSYESTPSIAPYGQEPKEFNAHISLEFLVLPQSQSTAHLVEARETAHQMAMEFYAAIRLDASLGGKACKARVLGKTNGYRNILSKRYQVSILDLIINQDERLGS